MNNFNQLGHTGLLGSRARRLFGGAAVEYVWVSAGTYAMYAAMFGVTVLVNRAYGTVELGRFGIAWAAAQLTVQSSVSGFSALHRRDVAMSIRPVSELVADTLGVRLVALSMLLAVVGATALVMPFPIELKIAVGAVTVAKAVEAIGLAFAETLQANGQNRIYALLSVANAASLLVSVAGIWLLGLDAIFIYPAIGIASVVYTAAAGLTYSRVFSIPSVHLTADKMKAALVESWPLMLNAVVFVVVGRAAILAVGILAGEAEAGVYTFAAGVVGGMSVVASAIGTVLFPELCATFARNPASLRLRMYGLVRSLGLMGLGATAVLVAVRPLVLAMYGDLPASAPSVLLALGVGLVPLFASVAPNYMFTAIGQQREGLLVAVLNGAVLLVLVLPLTARYGATGAAAGVSAAQAVMAVVTVIWLDRRHLRPFTHAIARSTSDCPRVEAETPL